MEGSSRFVRLVLFFDLPQETKIDQSINRQFVKYLKTEGIYTNSIFGLCKIMHK